MALAPYEQELADRVAAEARQIACALPPAAGISDADSRAGWTNVIIAALAAHDLERVAALALGAEMALAHRRVRSSSRARRTLTKEREQG